MAADATELQRVVDQIVEQGLPHAEQLQALAIEPFDLFTLACGTADTLRDQHELPGRAASLGALAFITGFLDGAADHQPHTPPRTLTDAVDHVHTHGRRTIIARHRDLTDTANATTITTTLLTLIATPTGGDEREGLERYCGLLYESGLATGLGAAGLE